MIIIRIEKYKGASRCCYQHYFYYYDFNWTFFDITSIPLFRCRALSPKGLCTEITPSIFDLVGYFSLNTLSEGLLIRAYCLTREGGFLVSFSSPGGADRTLSLNADGRLGLLNGRVSGSASSSIALTDWLKLLLLFKLSNRFFRLELIPGDLEMWLICSAEALAR